MRIYLLIRWELRFFAACVMLGATHFALATLIYFG